MTDVSLAAAFIAGLVSFLSPCVLPLVPGYISMLSGIGMEQLRQGQQPRGGLFASAVSFVIGFSVVFISFGASASAVGTFLLKNRAQLSPIAGALILLFGLHLVGVLAKLTFRSGIIIGSLLVVLGLASLFLAFGDRISRSGFGEMAEPRRASAQHQYEAGAFQWILSRLRVRVWVDTVHRADSRHRARACRRERHDCARDSAARDLLGGLSRALFAYSSRHRAVPQVLSALSKVSARRRTA
jgi:hypothetical protein